MLNFFLGLIVSLICSLGFANEVLQPLPSEQAFIFSTYVNEHDDIIFQWNIAPGYFLYQNKFNFSLSPTSDLKIGKISWPQSEMKTDPEGIKQSIYSGLVKVTVPLIGPFRGPLTLTISYQGCSLNGFCYAPVKKYLHVDLQTLKPMQNLTQDVTVTSSPKHFLSDQDQTQKIFSGHSAIFIVLSFLGLGLLLAFTPCVLPMIPILSSIIVGHQKKISTIRAFYLSLSYVMGMAITYAAAGIGVAYVGSSIQVILQKPEVIILVSGLFILLACGLFGFYELQLPAKLQHHTTRLSNSLAKDAYFSIFLMGCVSTLIVSPCVSAPLVGVLTYIAQTGDMLLGGVALLMLGIGMGIPLLIIGTSAGKWLPKAGPWMNLIKKLFGILMLGVAIWMLSRVFAGPVILLLWSFLCIGTGIYVGIFWRFIFRIVGAILIVYGLILLIGAMLGEANPLAPWDGWLSADVRSESSQYLVLNNIKQLDKQLDLAKHNHKLVMLDFYATWCVSCVYMDNHVFNNPNVRKALENVVELRADVTENNAFDKAIMHRYHVIAPPTILFFDTQGKEIISRRIIGEVSEQEFLKNLNEVKEGQRAK